MKKFKKIAIFSAIFVTILDFLSGNTTKINKKKKIITIMCTLIVVTTKSVIMNF